MNIYFDIETIPAQDPVAIELIKVDIEKQKLSVKAPSNYKDQEKIDAYIKVEVEKLDAEFDATYRKTSFDGGLGQICCISYAIDDQAPVSIYHECETDILDFFSKIKCTLGRINCACSIDGFEPCKNKSEILKLMSNFSM